jgi:uncharacterized protein (TIGR01777 family)
MPWRTAQWNPNALGAWAFELSGASVVINLAGRSVNCRYTPENQREIMQSRVESTRSIGEAIAGAADPPALWMNASTATIYRHVFDRPMDEATGELGGLEPGAPASWRFSIEVAKAWESIFFERPAPNTRKIALRSAMVMSPGSGGAFDHAFKLVRLGLGGSWGTGRQYMSWIHEKDFVRAIQFLMDHEELNGCINISSPNPIPNREFLRLLRESCSVPIGLPLPSPLLEIGAWIIGSETELLLKSRRVVPRRLTEAGFTFDFPNWNEAAKELAYR